MGAVRYESVGDLPPHLQKQAKALMVRDLVQKEQKKQVLQTTAKNDGFDSDGEREYYWCYLIPRVRRGEIADVKQQVEFLILDDFINSEGEKITGIKYTADFTYTEIATGLTFVVEVKAKKVKQTKVSASGKTENRNRSFTDTKESRLRWKLVQAVNKDNKNMRFRKWYRGQPYE